MSKNTVSHKCIVPMACLFLSVALCLTLLPCGESDADTAETFKVNEIRYKVVDGSAYGIDYAVEVTHSSSDKPNNMPDSDYEGTVIIPETVTYNSIEYSIIGIGANAFVGSYTDSSTIPEEKKLRVQLNDGLRYIEGFAFGSSSLEEIEIPASVVRIGREVGSGSVFSNSVSGPAIIKTVTFEPGSQLKFIGDSAFAGCGNITSLTLPEGLTHLGKMVFLNCKKLTDVVIPASLEDIILAKGIALGGTLTGWTHAKDVKFATGSPYENVNGILYKDTTLLAALDKNITSVSVREGTTAIEDYAFQLVALTSINLPEGLKTIGDDAFKYIQFIQMADTTNCIQNIVIPSTVQTIGTNFLYGALKADGSSSVIFLGESAPAIGNGAFATSFDRTQGVPVSDAKIWCNSDSLESYQLRLPDITSIDGFKISIGSSSVEITTGTDISIPVEINGPSGISISTSDVSDIARTELDGQTLKLSGNNVGQSTLTMSMAFGDWTLTTSGVNINVKTPMDDESSSTSSTKEIVTEDGISASITTTVTTDKRGNESTTITVKPEGGESVSAELEDSIDTNVDAVVTVNSDTALDKIDSSINIIEQDTNLTITVTAVIVVGDNTGDNKGTITIYESALEFLKNPGNGQHVKVSIKDYNPKEANDAQIEALGNGVAFKLSADKHSSDGTVEKITDLGGYVTVFLPYNENMGSATSRLGVYHIDDRGNLENMNAVFDSSKNGFTFRTPHFSMFAVMEKKVEPPFIPDDEDDIYIPPYVPSTGSGTVATDDESTKVLACAAAAAVAALMAVFLFIDSRKR